MSKRDSSREITKILILGLDNCGKTSILLSLQKNTNILSYFSIKPTQGLDIIKIEDGATATQFNIWELGGQEKYRSEYLKNMGKYSQATNKIIFVIDVQDRNRYELALQYLASIIDKLKELKVKPEISVFLHKFDPGLEVDERFSTEQISSKLIAKIKEIISSDFEFHVYRTTIYTVFQKNLLL